MGQSFLRLPSLLYFPHGSRFSSLLTSYSYLPSQSNRGTFSRSLHCVFSHSCPPSHSHNIFIIALTLFLHTLTFVPQPYFKLGSPLTFNLYFQPTYSLHTLPFFVHILTLLYIYFHFYFPISLPLSLPFSTFTLPFTPSLRSLPNHQSLSTIHSPTLQPLTPITYLHRYSHPGLILPLHHNNPTPSNPTFVPSILPLRTLASPFYSPTQTKPTQSTSSNINLTSSRHHQSYHLTLPHYTHPSTYTHSTPLDTP